MNKVNPEAWVAWELERIQDHPANRITDLMPWAYQDMIDAQNAEAEAKPQLDQRLRSCLLAELLVIFLQRTVEFNFFN